MIWLAKEDKLSANIIEPINRDRIDRYTATETTADKTLTLIKKEIGFSERFPKLQSYDVFTCLTNPGASLSVLIPKNEQHLKKIKKFNDQMRNTDFYKQTFGEKFPDLFLFIALLDYINFKEIKSYSIEELKSLQSKLNEMEIYTIELGRIINNIPDAVENQRILSFVKSLK